MHILTRSAQAYRLLIGTTGLVLAVAGEPVCAAEQGAVAAVSRGSIGITALVAVRNVVSGVSDVAETDASATQSICLWSNGATRGFGVAAAGDGPDGALSVDDGAGHAVQYDVAWGATALAAGSPRLGLTATASQPGCGTDQAGRTRLKITFASRVPHATGALSLLVIPQ